MTFLRPGYALDGYNMAMRSRQKRIAIVLAVVLMGMVCAWLLLPRTVELLPGQVRVRLPDSLLALVTTPLPTALPVPLRTADARLLESPAILMETATATLTPSPTGTATSSSTTEVSEPLATPRPPTVTVAPKPSNTPMPTPTPLPELVLIEGLEVTPQKYNNCGPANLSIILDYYGHQVHQLEIGEALKPNYEDRNVSPAELLAYVSEETAHEAEAYYGLELSDLKALLAADFPVIVEKGLELSATHGWMGHYLTLYGYDEQAQVFLGLDTFLGPWDSTGRHFEFAELERLWAQFNRATIVVYPSDRAGDLADILGEDKLDDASMWLAAAERAQEALATDYEDAFAWFDLGASLYHLGEIRDDAALYEQSTAAFDRAREIGLPWRTLWYQFEPYMAYLGAGRIDEVLALTEAVMTTSGGRNIEETYLFRGHALLASGDLEAAERAYERALRLNPGLDEAREALVNLARSAGNMTG